MGLSLFAAIDCSSQSHTNQRHLLRHRQQRRERLGQVSSLLRSTAGHLNRTHTGLDWTGLDWTGPIGACLVHRCLRQNRHLQSSLMGAVSWWECLCHSLLLLSPDNSDALETLLTPEMSEKEVILEAGSRAGGDRSRCRCSHSLTHSCSPS